MEGYSEYSEKSYRTIKRKAEDGLLFSLCGSGGIPRHMKERATAELEARLGRIEISKAPEEPPHDDDGNMGPRRRRRPPRARDGWLAS